MKSLLHRCVPRRARVAAFALLGVGLSACSANWQSFGFDAAQTRFNPETAAPSALAVRWTSTLGGPAESTPAVVDGTVYVGDDGGIVHALNAATGAPIWTFKTGGPVASSPAVDDGIVYVGSNDGNVYALAAGSGAPVWSFTTGGAVTGSPNVVGGVVYFGSGDAKVYAL